MGAEVSQVCCDLGVLDSLRRSRVADILAMGIYRQIPGGMVLSTGFEDRVEGMVIDEPHLAVLRKLLQYRLGEMPEVLDVRIATS